MDAPKQVETGRTVEDVARKCCGLDVSEAQRLRSLDDENSRAEVTVADLSLDKEMLNAVIAKNLSPVLNCKPEGRLGNESA